MLKLSDYAHGQDIGNGITSAVPAFNRAYGDVMQYRVPLLIDRPGNYLIDDTLRPPSFSETIGLGPLTQLVHAPALRNSVIVAMNVENVKLKRFYISGGVGREPPNTPDTQRVNHDSYGYFGAELTIDGTDVEADEIVMIEWNSIGATVAGKRPLLNRCWGRATPRPWYKPDSGPNASMDFGSTYAFMTPGTAICDSLRMINCGSTGTRGPGGFVGGTNGVIDGYYSADCHREYCPSDPTPGGYTSGGGQLALSRTAAPGSGPNSQDPHRWTIRSAFIMASEGPAVTGIEVDHAWGVNLENCHVNGSRTGINIYQSRMIRVTGDIGATKDRGLHVAASQFVNVAAGFEYCNVGVVVDGTCDTVDLRGSTFYANAVNYSIDPRAANVLR